MVSQIVKAHLDHRRTWQNFDFAYPVISRRSKGVSLGVNLSPDKACSFHCIYCEVDRIRAAKRRDVDLAQLEKEMTALLDLTISGDLFLSSPFDSARPEQRRLNDIAFSGDGEPTLCKVFTESVECMVRLLKERGLADVKLVLITNASGLQDPDIQRGLQILMENNGEIWAKLDAGTEEHYKQIDRSGIPFRKTLDNLLHVSKKWPITIQTLFLAWNGAAPSEEEVNAYAKRIQHLQDNGGNIQGIQLYTVARPTPEPAAKPLKATTLQAIADQIRVQLPGIGIEVFPGSH